MADAGSSSDEEPGADEARFIQEMCKEHGSLKVDPEDVRRQEIMEEVARRRSAKQQESADERARLRQKSDAIFGHFDADADGFLNYSELSALGAATGGGELSQLAYGAVCHEVGADAARGMPSAA